MDKPVLSTQFQLSTSKTKLSKNDFKTLKTWDRRSRFRYKGSVKEGTLILYGNGFSKEISAPIYERMLTYFKKRTVYCGTSQDNPQTDTLGMWLEENVSKAAIASYVGAILVSEGYAKKRCNEIEFP